MGQRSYNSRVAIANLARVDLDEIGEKENKFR